MTDTIPRLVLVVLAVALGGAPSLFVKSELQAVLGPVLGDEKVHVVRPCETLHDIACQYRLDRKQQHRHTASDSTLR